MRRRFLPLCVVALSLACDSKPPSETIPPAGGGGSDTSAGPESAQAFVSRVNDELKALWIASETAAWSNATDITPEHEAAESAAYEKVMEYLNRTIKEAQRFDDAADLEFDTRRQLDLLKVATTVPAPSDAAKRKELAEITTNMASTYGKGKFCPDGKNPLFAHAREIQKEKGEDAGDKPCLDIGELSDIMTESDDYDQLLAAWEGWRTVSPPMRTKYQRFVELSNEGAQEIGFADLGELWRSKYDMGPAQMEGEVERLYQQVKPLYEQLHCHVRAKLAKKYGKKKVPAKGPIPAHLLGNMWAQEWMNVYRHMEPHKGQPSIDVTKALQKKGYDEIKMVKTAEGFFTSLGLDPLPQTFWERSMFKQPEGREVVCHASAWDPSYNDDLRIKMCIKINMEDLVTIHHELGHNYYYHYYYGEPVLYQQGAHDGFHEGIGDTLALSVTPKYLSDLGLLDEVSESEKAVLNNQMQDGLEKISFLPFGLLIDKWRWDVFSGKTPPDEYNEAWWALRLEYQGIAPPVERSEADFDPGAKYHIPGNTPYMRYFLARILQFQFHKALCEAAGHKGPLHTCSIYGSKEAGAKLEAMLAMGASKPWPDALEAITGTREMDAGPMLEYFQPLAGYLEKQNSKRECGWDQ